MDALVHNDEVVLLAVHAEALLVDIVCWVRGTNVPAVRLVWKEVLRCACARGLRLDGVGRDTARVCVDTAPFPTMGTMSVR
jgi:hypothetical protein